MSQSQPTYYKYYLRIYVQCTYIFWSENHVEIRKYGPNICASLTFPCFTYSTMSFFFKNKHKNACSNCYEMHIQTVSSLSIFLKVRNSSKLTFIHYFEKGIIALFKKKTSLKILYFFFTSRQILYWWKKLSNSIYFGDVRSAPFKMGFSSFFCKVHDLSRNYRIRSRFFSYHIGR